MSNEHLFDDSGKVRRKKQQKTADPQKKQNESSGHLDANSVTRLQQTVGNAAVQRLLAQRQENGGPTEIDEETAVAIQRQKGQGQSLDTGMAQKAGDSLGQDFSDVTVHTDGQADKLSRQLGAKAFTTGKDIYFREGEYQPHSQDGQKLLSHELTHVVQQQGKAAPDVQGKLTVNDPNDQYEAEANQVADKVAGQSQPAAVQREAVEEEEMVQTQTEEEEVQMQAEEEEIQLQPEEEEIQMQEMDEEEVVSNQ
jgi:hypothetical protein